MRHRVGYQPVLIDGLEHVVVIVVVKSGVVPSRHAMRCQMLMDEDRRAGMGRAEMDVGRRNEQARQQCERGGNGDEATAQGGGQ
jgi:hypothetical protein